MHPEVSVPALNTSLAARVRHILTQEGWLAQAADTPDLPEFHGLYGGAEVTPTRNSTVIPVIILCAIAILVSAPMLFMCVRASMKTGKKKKKRQQRSSRRP